MRLHQNFELGVKEGISKISGSPVHSEDLVILRGIDASELLHVTAQFVPCTAPGPESRDGNMCQACWMCATQWSWLQEQKKRTMNENYSSLHKFQNSGFTEV